MFPFRLTLALVCLGLTVSLGRAAVFEPDTWIYGRIVNRTTGQDYVVTSGSLAWRVEAGTDTAIAAEGTGDLAPYQSGAYSYAFRLTHQAVSNALSRDGEALPLGVTAADFRTVSLKVEGLLAKVAPGYSDTFALSQTTRGQAIRIDFEVEGELADTDQDGLPDWWETLYGLDLLVDDSLLDPDEDGLPNHEEFRLATNPLLADLSPTVAGGTTLVVPVGGQAALAIRALDADTPATGLEYVLKARPATGRLSLLKGASNGRDDAQLGIGDSFTQAQVDAGRVVYSHPGGIPAVIAVDLQLSDGVHPALPTPLTVSILPYPAQVSDSFSARNLSERVQQMLAANLDLAGLGEFIIHDARSSVSSVVLRTPSGPALADEPLLRDVYAAAVQTAGRDRPRLILGGAGADTLLGSGEPDLLAGGAGRDTLRGYAGADHFLFSTEDLGAGLETIVDFTPGEGDAIDLRSVITLPEGVVPTLDRFIRLTAAKVLEVDANGDGSGYTDLKITLGEESSIGDPSVPHLLTEWWAAGNLLTPFEVVPVDLVSIEATDAEADESGSDVATFVLRRIGSLHQALTVGLNFEGTAENGVDYAALAAVATFPAGVDSLELVLRPLADTLREATETVVFSLQTGGSYDVSSDAGSATATIKEVRPPVWLETLTQVGYLQPRVSALVALHRSGLLDQALEVTLELTGTAEPGIDFAAIVPTQTIPVGVDRILIEIQPLDTAVIGAGNEIVGVAIVASEDYAAGGNQSAQLVLARRIRSISEWISTALPAGSGAEALAQDSDGDGLSNLLEFATGLDPLTPDDPLSLGRGQAVLEGDGRVGFEFYRLPDAAEIDYEVWMSRDLIQWQEMSAENAETTILEFDAMGRERVRMVPTPPAAAAIEMPQVFFQLRVQTK